MKKVLIFHHYNSSVGAGLSLLHILQSLSRDKLEVTVCLPKIKGDLDLKVLNLGYKVIYSDAVIPYMHFSGNHTLFLSRRHLQNCMIIKQSLEEIHRIIQEEKAEYVLVNSMTLFWMGKIAKKCGAKAICFHRETYRKGLFGVRTNYIKKELSRNFDVVAFLSNYDMRETPCGKAHYVRITDKVDVDKYALLEKKVCRVEEKLPLNENLILYAGGMAKLKGAETIVKAMPFVKTQNTKLVFLQYQKREVVNFKDKIKNDIKILLGKNLSFKIEKYIEKNSIEDRVIFRPATDEVEKYFVACDAVVFPSIDAHQARPAYEAGIAKRPFIITDFINTREFADKSNAWLFKRKNYIELASCIDEALSGKFVEKVDNNYKRSMKDNNLKNLSRELLNIFEIIEKENNE